jgi:hypothetical protein
MNLHENTLPTFYYRGDLCIKLMQGQRVIETKHFHNKGLDALFNIIGKALIGDYTISGIPTFIRLYTFKDTARKPKPFEFNWENQVVVEGSTQTLIPCTIRMRPNALPTLNSANQAKFQFKIPYSFITESQVYMAALLPADATTDETEPYRALAYYMFTNGKSGTQLDWEPIEIANASSNNSLLIEWTMSFGNLQNTDELQTTEGLR